MNDYTPAGNRWPDPTDPPPVDPPVDLGIEDHTWRVVADAWLAHTDREHDRCLECGRVGYPCPMVDTYGLILTGLVHRAEMFGPMR